ncbi:MAG TPA: NRDE family protein, partial [Cyclobacteriaceae bacterium]|nr:NRDE family protein [Cyclobacteriaceae bacterium]
MCTVTFVPVKEGFFLSTNRDEIISRARVEWPVEEERENFKLLYPRDQAGSGTWVIADSRNNAACLLNGAFLPHTRREKYRHSRGLILRGIFSFPSMQDFADQYNLDDIEPFTLIVVWDKHLFEFRWDGGTKHLYSLEWKNPKIWSSVTLYSPDMVKLREAWFNQWMGESGMREINTAGILSFHKSADNGDPGVAIRMKRENIQTISITSIFASGNGLEMHYIDLVNLIEGSSGFKS